MPSGVEFPRSYLRTLLAEDEAARDHAAARAPRRVELDPTMASVTALDDARARLHPETDIAAQLAALVAAAQPWRADAACLGIDPDLFFPTAGDPAKLREARQVCAGCTVRDECLEYAVEHDERDGVWGGTSERQRRRLRRERRSGSAGSGAA